MVMKLDSGFFDRARAVDANRHRAALKTVLRDAQPVSAQPDAIAAEVCIDALWDDAAMFGFTFPVSVQKYVLIILTQSKWQGNRLHWLYARRMIGLPDQDWRLESGVAAVYRNVVAQHYLGVPVTDFITSQDTV